jgi:hypothetical protein
MKRFSRWFARLSPWIREPEWFTAFSVAVLICGLVYILNLLVGEIHPGNIWGLTYGTLASLIMAAAALLGVRRRVMNLAAQKKLGKAISWVNFHLYAGTLSLLLVLMHSGFHVPTGTLNWWLWLLSIWVTVSGLAGVLIQKAVPRVLASALSIEVLYDRIPELVEEIRKSSEQLVETCVGPIQDFYRKNISSELVSARTQAIFYVDITGGIQSQMRDFDYLRKTLSAEQKEKLNRLETLYRTKLEIDAHYTLQKALRLWLYTHVPVSLVLLVLMLLHIYISLYY